MRLSVCITVCLAAAPAVAVESAGSITATLGGEPMEWRTLATLEGAASATVSAQPGFTGVTIQGHPVDGPLMENVLSITLGYLGAADPAAEPYEVTVALFPEGLGGGFWTSEDAARPAEVSFTRLDGPEGRAEGRFAALLCFKASTFQPADPDDCTEIEGSFDTALAAE